MSKRSSASDFEIIGKLGEGSFGTVFKVKRLIDNNIYVMKIIKISQMDKRGQQESINEVRILASLDNPYIVRYFDSFIEKNTLHIIMEFCDKGDLCNQIRIQNGRLLIEAKIWKYFIQMCLGLEYIHSKKILHRDIKSMNVFLVKEDSVRIGDLGVAKVLSSTAAFAHTTVGTPYYLSPELCEERPYNVKSDVWALGCVLYEMCTLKHPFDANNQGALILKILRANYSPISSQYSPELKDLVTMCLHKDYKKRPSVSSILKLPGMRDRANSLNIPIPNGSVLSEIPGPKAMPAPYQSRMDVIEEEKVMKINSSEAPKAGDVAKKTVLSKSPSAQGRISAGKPDLPKPTPAQPKVNKPIENPKAVPKYAPVPEIPKFQGNQKKVQDEPVKFDQPRPISALNAPRVPTNIKSAPKQKVLKPAIPQYRPPQRPKEIPQSARRASAEVNKRISDIESIPKLPEYPKKISVKDLREENKQEIPIKPKIEPPKLVKLETKKYECLNKPVISLFFLNEEKPIIQEPKIQNKIHESQFSSNIQESQLSTKINSESSGEEYEEMTTHSLDYPDTHRNYEEETIPISVTQNFDNSIYRVHYVKPQSTPSEAISSDSEDQAYEEPSSSSSEDEPWSSGEEEEEDEEFSQTRQGMQIKLVEYAKKEEDFEKMINQKKKELIKKIGKSTYGEFYQYFKAKANVILTQEKGELTTQEEAAIEQFVSLKISSENIEVIYTMYKILHLEDELARFREESSQLQKKLS